MYPLADMQFYIVKKNKQANDIFFHCNMTMRKKVNIERCSQTKSFVSDDHFLYGWAKLPISKRNYARKVITVLEKF